MFTTSIRRKTVFPLAGRLEHSLWFFVHIPSQLLNSAMSHSAGLYLASKDGFAESMVDVVAGNASACRGI